MVTHFILASDADRQKHVDNGQGCCNYPTFIGMELGKGSPKFSLMTQVIFPSSIHMVMGYGFH